MEVKCQYCVPLSGSDVVVCMNSKCVNHNKETIKKVTDIKEVEKDIIHTLISSYRRLKERLKRRR